MQEIETISWVETHTRWGQPSGEHRLSMQRWFRMTPPAETWYVYEGRNSWSKEIWDDSEEVVRASTHKTSRSGSFEPEDLLRRVIFQPSAEDSRPTRPELRWQFQPVEDEPGPTHRWFREYVKDNFRIAETVWTEPETHRVVRKESRQTDLLTGRLAAVQLCDRFTYNEEPPAGTVDMPGDRTDEQARALGENAGALPEVWGAMSARERRVIQALIDRSDRGWRSADFRTFASAWQFDFVSLVPRRREWRRRTWKLKGPWTEWNSEVQTVRRQKLILVQVAGETYMFSRERRTVLDVWVRLRIGWQGGAWEGAASFYLRRKRRGYRIVHWECPWEEIRAAAYASDLS